MTASKIGQHLEAIADRLAAIGSIKWRTPPAAAWYPDFDRAEYEAANMTALVLPVNQPLELETRGEIDGDLSIHVAIIAPITSAPGDLWNAGDAVVLAAETIANDLLKRTIGQYVCTAAEHGPIVSRDSAKQYTLWISYLTTVWRRAE